MGDTIRYASIDKPWLKYYPEKYLNAPFPQCTMYTMIRKMCAEKHHEDATALHYYGTDITYSQMFEKIDLYAAAFYESGVRKGDYVTILSVAIPETYYTIYALNKLGAVCNFIDVRTDRVHTAEFIRKAKSDVLVTLEQCFSSVEDKLDALALRLVICQKPSSSLKPIKRILFDTANPKYKIPYDGKRIISDLEFSKRGIGKKYEEAVYEPDMPAVITRTGGTTGVSKGVVLTNDNLNAIAFNFMAMVLDNIPDRTSLLNFLPVGVSYGIAVGVHMALCLSFTDILIPKFDVNEFASLVAKFKPNHIIGVPVFYEKLITSKKMRNMDLSFINTMAAGGDSANDALEDKLDAFRIAHNIPYPVAQGYGMSEASSAVSFGFMNVHKKGSTGIPSLTVTVAAFKPGTFEELPLGQPGEICITGKTLMKEYLDEPEETKNVLKRHPDGKLWVHSGDLGYIDEDGFLFIIGRIKRTIVRFDAHKSYPLQIERAIMQHESVSNCAVIPVKDTSHVQGELPLAVIELDNACQNPKEKIISELKQLCIENIEKRSQPAGFVFVDAIPITNSAKNDVRTLQTQYYNYKY